MIKFQKLITTLLSAISLLSAAYGQSDKQRIEAYISQYKELAISEMLRTGVPASITLAQGILETAGGQSDLASIANNHFGIKCKTEWTGDRMLHDDDAKNECFRKYSSVEDSYKDHSDFLRSRPNYAFLFKLDLTDYEGWAKGLKRAGYATSSTYSSALVRMVVENNLQQYTLIGLQRKEFGDEIFANTGSVNSNLQNQDSDDEQKEKKAISFLTNPKSAASKTSGYPSNSVFNVNDLKAVYAEAGTSLFALANNYNVSFKKLLEFNELEELDILPVSQLIYLEKKSKKGTKEIHIVEENESLHDISQKEGIQLSAMMELNGLRKDMKPATGEKIYLKSPAPSTPRLASNTQNKRDLSMK